MSEIKNSFQIEALHVYGIHYARGIRWIRVFRIAYAKDAENSASTTQTERPISSIPYIWKCDRRWVAFVNKRASEILSENTIVDVERASEIDTVGTSSTLFKPCIGN